MNKLSLKKIILLLPSKKYLFTLLVVFLLFLIILFPYNDAVQKILYRISQSNLPVQILYNSHHFGFFPLQLSFQGVRMFAPQLSQPIRIEKLVIKPYYWSLLSLRTGIKLQLHTKNSQLNFLLNKTYTKDKGTKPIHIRVQSQNLTLETLNIISPFFNQSQGVMEIFADLTLDLNSTKSPEGFIQVRARNVELQPYSFSAKYIGTITTPFLQWKTIDGKFQFKKGDFFIDSLNMGPHTAPLSLQANGVVRLHWSPLSRRLKSYDTELKMIMNEKIKNQFFFVELFLVSVEKKLDNHRYQYNARISGQYPKPPKIQKLRE